jgi:hypothetical protein
MKFPAIAAVAKDLRAEAKRIDWCRDYHRHNEECNSCDVRLQVYPDGAWAVRVGLSDYDQDHRGFWGASCIPRGRFNATDLARDLVNQCRDHHAATRE